MLIAIWIKINGKSDKISFSHSRDLYFQIRLYLHSQNTIYLWFLAQKYNLFKQPCNIALFTERWYSSPVDYIFVFSCFFHLLTFCVNFVISSLQTPRPCFAPASRWLNSSILKIGIKCRVKCSHLYVYMWIRSRATSSNGECLFCFLLIDQCTVTFNGTRRDKVLLFLQWSVVKPSPFFNAKHL